MKQEYRTEPFSSASNPSRGRSSESITDLIRHLASDVSSLLGKEIALAKSEVRESVSEVQTAIAAIATGVAIAMAGLVVLLMSAVYGLSNVVEPWLAALIVGVASLLVGYLMVRSAREKMSASSIMPDRTIKSTKKDIETLGRATQ